MANVDGLCQVKFLHKRRQVVGVSVHVISVPGLAGSAMPAAVVSDAAIAVVGQEKHLVFPGIGTERPTVTEDNGLAAAPVFVVNRCPVFGCNCVGHGASFPFLGSATIPTSDCCLTKRG